MASAHLDPALIAARLDRARAAMRSHGVEALLVSVGRDLPYLAGYEAMPLERVTMLVVLPDGEASLVVPALEAARVTEMPGAFSIVPWHETDDAIGVIAGLLGTRRRVAIG
ncbi:MAG: aminopeptidase P family N-terminal domain-containing protein, partial [Ilumatobacteraceae bacterium]